MMLGLWGMIEVMRFMKKWEDEVTTGGWSYVVYDCRGGEVTIDILVVVINKVLNMIVVKIKV